MKTLFVIGCIVALVIGIALGIIGNIVGATETVGTILMFWGVMCMIWAAAFLVARLVYREAEGQPTKEE